MWGRFHDHLRGLHERLRGWRTASACALVGLIGLLNDLGQIDLRPLVSYFVSSDKAIGAVMTALAIVFAVCRFATRTAIFEQRPKEPH